MAFRSMVMRNPPPMHHHAVQMEWTDEMLKECAEYPCRVTRCRNAGLRFKDHLLLYEWPSSEARVPYLNPSFMVDHPERFHYFHGVYCPFVALYAHHVAGEPCVDAALCASCYSQASVQRTAYDTVVEACRLANRDHVSYTMVENSDHMTCSNCGQPGGRRDGR